MSRRNVADIVEIEAEDAAKARMANRGLCASQSLDRQAMIVDPLLPVLGDHAPGEYGLLYFMVLSRTQTLTTQRS